MTALQLPMNKLRRIAFDMTRLSAGGLNGGVKVYHLAFLEELCKRYANRIIPLAICREELIPELAFLSISPHSEIHVVGERSDFEPRDSENPLPLLRYWPSSEKRLLSLMAADALYCGMGYSEFYCSGIPAMCLFVDTLHKDLPEFLPQEEVAFRESWFKDSIDKCAKIQVISKFCKEQLVKHYNLARDDVFVTYLPLHERFAKIAMGGLPTVLSGRPYFFYPANFWPHKNHERLLEAYALYLKHADKRDAWDLALTGYMNEKGRAAIVSLSKKLGLEEKIHFLGHLSLDELRTTWESCAAMVFPSLYEGFGIPIVEAFHFQAPVACSNAASLPEVGGNCCHYFDPTDTKQIADCLLHLQTEAPSEEKRRRCSSRLAKFRMDREADKLAKELLELCEN